MATTTPAPRTWTEPAPEEPPYDRAARIRALGLSEEQEREIRQRGAVEHPGHRPDDLPGQETTSTERQSTKALVLDRDTLKQAHRRIGLQYSALTGREGRPARLYGVFEVILYAYPDMDAESLLARIESLIADHGPEVRRVIEDHSPGATNYVASRDWLYDGPEVLLIADLTRNYPSRLRAVAVTSDFSTDLEAMAAELNGR